MAAGVEAAAGIPVVLLVNGGPGPVETILALMVLEGVALIAYWQWTGRGIAPLSVVVNLTSGAALLLALLAVVSGWGTTAVVACLLLSFAAHIADLALRWR